MIAAFLLGWVLLCFSAADAAQIEPVSSREIITIPSKEYPVETTTVSPSFTVPAANVGTYRVTIPCDPEAHLVVRLEDESGRGYGGFTRSPGPCPTPESGLNTSMGGDFVRAPIPKSTPLRIRITNNAVIKTNKTIEISFDKVAP
jgi:hypothetical protein